MKKELAPKYNHLDVEQGYDNWIKEGYFTAGDKSKDPFCIVIPPPNVTGKLHLGHAWDTTLQDIIARYKRDAGLRHAVGSGYGSRRHRNAGEGG